MWLTRTAILRPVTMTMVVIAIMVMGYTALSRMGVDLYPDVDFPFVTITTVYVGAGPEEVETQITKPIEDAVSLTSGVKTVTSTSQESVSLVFMEFELGTDLDTAVADVRSKVDATRASLPREIDAPIITKADVQAFPVLDFGIESPRPPKEIRDFADEIISQRLAQVSGVAAVSVSGGEIREILVSVDKGRLEAYGLSISQVSSALTMENLNLPSGNITEGPKEYAVRAIGEFQSIADIEEVRLQTSSDAVISLKDIATVSDSVAERRSLTRLNGRDSVTVSVLKQAGANTVAVAQGVKKELEKLTGQSFLETGGKNHKQTRKPGLLPSDITIELGYDQSKEVLNTIAEVRLSLILGALLATGIVFLFLHNIRGTFIVGLAIPTSVLATFAPIYFGGFTLNMMVLLGLSLSVGILVDDSIVVLENIWRHLRKGEPPREAAFKGRTEIGLAAITITLVDVVVFVPIAFMGGIVGQFFRQFGITVATATLFSLFISFTLTPMLASRWFKKEDAEEKTLEGSRLWRFFALFDKFYDMLDRQYHRLLRWALNHRAATVFTGLIALLACIAIAFMGAAPFKAKLGFAIFLSFLGLFGFAFSVGSGRTAVTLTTIVSILLVLFTSRTLGFEMFPQSDTGNFQVSIEMPPGTSLAVTSEVARQFEDFMLDENRFPEIENVLAYVGSSGGSMFGGGGSDPTVGNINAVLVERSERERSDIEIMEEVRKWAVNIPGPKVTVKRIEQMGGGGEYPIEIVLSGENTEELLRSARIVAGVVEEIEGTKDVDISWKEGRPELQARIDRIALADRGLSALAVAGALRTSLEGSTNTKLRDKGNEYDIRVRLQESDRSSLEQIRQIPVSFNGGIVRLEDIAELKLASSPNKIDRRNRVRTISVYSDVLPGYFEGNLAQLIKPAVDELNLDSVSVSFAGQTEQREESMGSINQALLLSIILVYILMAALFEGYLSPFIIMFSLPMALVGALLALVLTGASVSIVAMIGVIMLMGLVTKNAILLVDYTNTLRAEGMDRQAAILQAGPTRLRPILMTTLAMIFGMLPTAAPSVFRLVEGAEWRAPMAIAVIGGLIVSTLLTLLVIPVLYTVFDDIGAVFMRLLKAVLRRLFP